jgi:SPOR domain
MKKNIYLLIFASLFTFLLVSCSASTSGRYETNEKKPEKKEEAAKKNNEENFDLTPYRATFNVEKKENQISQNIDAWYSYDDKAVPDTSALQIISQKNGYRVQVFSTDNLNEADSLRSELYMKTNQKAIYISFDPPFYKVKVGDFLKISEAKDLSFKLNQIGYTETRVINDKVNIYNK